MNIYAYMSHGDPGELADYIEGDSGPSIPDDALRGALANALRRIDRLENELAKREQATATPAASEEPNVFWACPCCEHQNRWHWEDKYIVPDEALLECDGCSADVRVNLTVANGRLYGVVA